MPIFDEEGSGDLFIEYNVVLPSQLSPELKKSTFYPVCIEGGTNVVNIQSWWKRSRDMNGLQGMSYKYVR